MSFWTGIEQNQGSFELGGDFKIIPNKTRVVAVAEEATNKTSNVGGSFDRYINLRWKVAAPEEFKGVVFFQKLRVYDTDQEKALKAKRMLAAIATNAGGMLAQQMQQRNESEPSDLSLMSLTMKPMVCQLGVWELGGKSGNYVQAVSPYQPTQNVTAPANPMQQAPAQPAQPTQNVTPAADNFNFDDSIPF